MGVKLVVFNDREPEIGVVFRWVEPNTAGLAQGWHGKCTQCGRSMHFWIEKSAMSSGQAHVDRH